MRIALFHNLPSGGAKRTVYEQATWLSKKHQIDLFSLSTANRDFLDIQAYIGRTVTLPFQPSQLLKSPFGRINQGLRWIDLIRLSKKMEEMAEQIDQGGYDLALVHPCQFSYSPALLKYLKTPSLYYRQDMVRWVHDPKQNRPYDSRGLRKKIDLIDPMIKIYQRKLIADDRANMASASRTITNSFFMRESLFRFYGTAPHVCYQGVDTDLFRPSGSKHDDFILSVGMIHPFKGYDFLINSISTIEKGSRPGLIIVGNISDTNELSFLQSLAKHNDVQVVFKQMIDLEELISLYRTARCVAYSPYLESFGLVPLEAMACGTPVVGVCEGGVRETILDGQTGFLVERDPAEFADALMSFRDENLRTKMGKHAREYISERWTIKSAIERLEKEMAEANA